MNDLFCSGVLKNMEEMPLPPKALKESSEFRAEPRKMMTCNLFCPERLLL